MDGGSEKKEEMTSATLQRMQGSGGRESDEGEGRKMAHKCILAMVKPDLIDRVVDAAKEAGATGATILQASGTGAGEAKTFFGLSLDVRTDVVLLLVRDTLVESILSAIKEAGRFSEPGTGIAMVLAVEQTAGIESQLSKTRA
jgi:nitrogen regulatory protein PII